MEEIKTINSEDFPKRIENKEEETETPEKKVILPSWNIEPPFEVQRGQEWTITNG